MGGVYDLMAWDLQSTHIFHSGLLTYTSLDCGMQVLFGHDEGFRRGEGT